MQTVPQNSLLVKIPGDVSVCVSDDIRQMTAYVLLEKEDWFEDEMDFVRRLAFSGMNALDIGANHGVYSLTMAKLVGDSGHVWALEPASQPGDKLFFSIQANGLDDRLTLIRAALSDTSGTAQLNLGSSSELNTLQAGSGGPSETITLKRLDDLLPLFGDRQIDFIKLDAEGEETRVLAGGQEFFSKYCPVVLFELKHGSAVNMQLLDSFRSLGMENYYLVPGMSALVPVEAPEKLDAYTLNLFAMRPEQATALAERGLLLKDCPSPPEDVPDFVLGFDLHAALHQKPFVQKLDLLAKESALEPQAWYLPLAGLLIFESESYSPADRWIAGQWAKKAFELLFSHGDTLLVALIAYIRLLRGLGYRGPANYVMGNNLACIEQIRQSELEGLFLPPFAVADQRVMISSPRDWLVGCCIEFLECQRTLSSYFSPDQSLVTKALALADHSLAMKRRFALRSFLSGKRVKITPDSPLCKAGIEGHINPEAWQVLGVAMQRQMTSARASAQSATILSDA